MRDEDVRNRLESLGAAPPPPPSAGFLDDLSQRLLVPDRDVPRAHRRPLFARPEVLTPILSAALRRGEMDFFPKDQHYTVAGNRRIAQEAASFIRVRVEPPAAARIHSPAAAVPRGAPRFP